MSTFLKLQLYGYNIDIKPYEVHRRFLRYHRRYLPYMDGQQVWLVLEITPPKNVPIEEQIQCLWLFKKLDDNQRFGSGEFTIHLSTKAQFKTVLKSELLLLPAKYALELQLKKIPQDVPEYKPQAIATLSVRDSGEVVEQLLLPLFISVITVILSVGLSVIVSILVAGK